MKYEVGMKAEFTKTIAESDVYLFAGLTGDMNEVHINSAAAEKSIFGRRIVHGILVTGLISNVIGMQLPGSGTIYLEQNVKFLKPVFIGDTVTARVQIEEVINIDKGIYKLYTCVFNQNADMVIDGSAIVKNSGVCL